MRSITGKNGKEYVLEEIIGEGAFGKVYSSPPYAIKEIKLKSDAKARSILMN